MPIQNQIELLRRILCDISPAKEEESSPRVFYIPEATKRLPLPYMVLLTILIGTNCKYVKRPAEKTAWSIDLRFKNVPFYLECGKSGLRIATVISPDDPLVDEFVQVLVRAFPVVDRVLQPDIEAQVRAGNVTIQNRHHIFRQRYEFFRDHASQAFETPPPLLDNLLRKPEETDGKPRIVDLFRSEREGFFYGSAAIDAYFSWLEHILVLVLPFVEYDPINDDLVEFISLFWTEKLKRIWNLTTDTYAKRLYESLREIKERFRNSLAHGGLEKGDSSLAVHVPGFGAIPARLSRFTESIQYGVFPLKEASFTEAGALFDLVDVHLREGPTRYGMKFVERGLDVAFDVQSCDEYKNAMKSDGQFDELLNDLTELANMNANMDW